MIYQCISEIIDRIGAETTTFPDNTYAWCKPYCVFIVYSPGNIEEKAVTVRDFGMVYNNGIVSGRQGNLPRILMPALVFSGSQIKD